MRTDCSAVLQRYQGNGEGWSRYVFKLFLCSCEIAARLRNYSLASSLLCLKSLSCTQICYGRDRKCNGSYLLHLPPQNWYITSLKFRCMWWYCISWAIYWWKLDKRLVKIMKGPGSEQGTQPRSKSGNGAWGGGYKHKRLRREAARDYEQGACENQSKAVQRSRSRRGWIQEKRTQLNAINDKLLVRTQRTKSTTRPIRHAKHARHL